VLDSKTICQVLKPVLVVRLHAAIGAPEIMKRIAPASAGRYTTF